MEGRKGREKEETEQGQEEDRKPLPKKARRERGGGGHCLLDPHWVGNREKQGRWQANFEQLPGLLDVQGAVRGRIDLDDEKGFCGTVVKLGYHMNSVEIKWEHPYSHPKVTLMYGLYDVSVFTCISNSVL